MRDCESDIFRSLQAHLTAYADLSPADFAFLEPHLSRHLKSRDARQDIIGEGDSPRSVVLLCDGWACRYKELADGRRQIVSFLVPGDIGYTNICLLETMDHSVGTITPARFAHLPANLFEQLIERSPALATAVRRQDMVSVGTAHEWTTNIGQRRAPERLAHLMCELFLRLRAVGLVDGSRCTMPLTQADLASATGLTEIHVNRSLQELRRRNLLQLEGRVLSIPDLGALKAACMFSDNYLHLGRPRNGMANGCAAGVRPQRIFQGNGDITA